MFLRQFHYLIALEQEGHFGRAAERCNVSQPTLSNAIKKLEEELGVPIILRDQRFQGFTSEGQRVVEWSKRILADREAMVDDVRIMRGNLNGRLRIAAMPMSMPVTGLINRLVLEHHPDVLVDIQFCGLTELKRGLANFEFDVGLTYLEEQPLDRLNTLALYKETFHLLIPENDWFEGRDAVTWGEAADIPLGLLSPSTHERQITDRAFQLSGKQPKPRMESNALINLAFHVSQGHLGTVVPKYFMSSIGSVSNSRLLVLQEPQVTQTVGLVWLQGNPMMPMTKAVVALIEEALLAGVIDSDLTNL